jgi:glycerol-3-phosphate dehydrogenase
MRDLKSIFSQEEYDLVIVGGGINGAAIANIAAGQGLKVALVEKEDFAGGTSSKSTKLIHGGLRYLEHFEFDLVRESLRERFIQLKNVPHLVRPLAFVVPVYRGDRRPLWMMRLGVFLYVLLSGRYVIERHRSLTAGEVLDLNPGLRREGLLGGVMYFDAEMDDARLCLENVLNAKARGADVANYVEAVSFLKTRDRVVGVHVRDVLSAQDMTLKARRVVAAAGPWTNAVLRLDAPQAPPKVRMTKGVHLVYQQKLSERALLLQTRKDARFFFIIPWGNHSLIGTTDTDYAGRPDDVEVGQEDIDYLLAEARRIFPDIPFRGENIVTTFAGLRPLVLAPGAPGAVSRRHVIEENASGVIYVMGGKYTTYRAIAEECVSRVMGGRKFNLGMEYPLYGSGTIGDDVTVLAEQCGVPTETLDHLKSRYGTRCREVLALVGQDRSLGKLICSCSPAIAAQVVYAIKTELAQTADDIIWRRMGIGYGYCPTKQCRRVIDLYMKNG